MKLEALADAIRIEYGELSDDDYWKPYKKAIVTYFIATNNGYSLDVIKVGRKKKTTTYSDNSEKIKDLNDRNMVMYSFSLDLWGDMMLYFTIWKKHTGRNIDLRFTPIKIQYDFEE